MKKENIKLKELPIKKIKPNPLQIREYFDREKIKELAKSIKEVGIINPIQVRPKGKEYEIIAGERRWKACQVAGKKTIPAIIKNIDGTRVITESLIENIHRENLSDIEKAKALRIIMKKKNIKKLTELSKIVGLSNHTVGEILDSAEIRKELEGPSRKVSQSVISETRGLPREERKKIIKIAAKKDLGGRKIRKLVSIIKEAPEPLKKQILRKEIDPETAEKKLKEWKEEPKPVSEGIAAELICPICKTKLYLIHKEPKGHKVKEAF